MSLNPKIKDLEDTNKSVYGDDSETVGDQDRLKTGIPRLDYILKGGFLRGGTYLLIGPPGAGKTILGNQACFNLIRLEKAKCLYVTLLTESHSKMIRHLRPLKFFNEKVISDQKLVYLSAYQVLRNEGVRGVIKMVHQGLKKHKATMLVIDGIESARRIEPIEQNYLNFLYELMSITQLYACTSIFLGGSSEQITHPENAIVDGIIELKLNFLGPRSIRELTVHKLRGSDFLAGKHEVEITESGIQIHPRTEIQFDKPKGIAEEERVRMGFGVPSLDQMLLGGPFSGSTTALFGSPGTGKTFLGLSFLVEGAKKGHRGIYYGFYEPPPRLIQKAESIGLPLRKFIDSGLIELIWQPPLEHFLDSLAEQLLEKIHKERTKRRVCLFIDGVEGFRAANPYPERMGRFLSALTNQLRSLDVTTIISEELGLLQSEVVMPTPELGHVVEGVILLRLLELRSQLHRLISILKMRESAYDTSIREFKILSSGIHVDQTFDSAELLLSGQARTVPPHHLLSKTPKVKVKKR